LNKLYVFQKRDPKFMAKVKRTKWKLKNWFIHIIYTNLSIYNITKCFTLIKQMTFCT
jgi:hypothetical protein